MVRVAAAILLVPLLAACEVDQDMKSHKIESVPVVVRRPTMVWGRSVPVTPASALEAELVHLEFDEPKELVLYLNDPNYRFLYPNTNVFNIYSGNGHTSMLQEQVASVRGTVLSLSARTLIVRTRTDPAGYEPGSTGGAVAGDASIRLSAAAALGSPSLSERVIYDNKATAFAVVAPAASRYFKLSAWSTHAQVLAQPSNTGTLTDDQLYDQIEVSEWLALEKGGSFTFVTAAGIGARGAQYRQMRPLAPMTNQLRVKNNTAQDIYVQLAERFLQ